MKNNIIILILLFMFISGISFAQTGIIINSGAKLKANSAYIKVNDGDFINKSSGNYIDGTVIFTGNSQQVIGGTTNSEFSSIEINNSAGVNLENDIYIYDELILNSGVLDISDYVLTLGEFSFISGSFSENSMINLDGTGNIIKEINSDDDILFPIGNMNSGTDYSPVELKFNSGTYNSASYTIDVTNSKHPNNTSTTDYLTRYWTITSNGISNFSCDANFHYTSDDIIGLESNIYGGVWKGSDWTMLGQASGNSFSGTLNEFGDITGAEENMFVGINNIINADVNVKYNNGLIQINSSDNFKISHVEIYNSLGQLIFIKDLNSGLYNEISFDKSSGYYLLKLNTDKSFITKKIFIN